MASPSVFLLYMPAGSYEAMVIANQRELAVPFTHFIRLFGHEPTFKVRLLKLTTQFTL